MLKRRIRANSHKGAMQSPINRNEEANSNSRMSEPPPNWPHSRTSTNDSVASDIQEEEERTPDEEVKKKTRGPTLMHKGWAADGGILEIKVNEFGQPIEAKASRLASNLGVLARDGVIAPLAYTDWRHIPNHILDNIWRQIKENTNATDGMRNFLMSSVCKKWRDWKSALKKNCFYKYNTNEERLANVPARVEEDQWRTLVYHWDTPEAEVKSIKNKACRAKLIMPHTSGRRSSAQVRDEMEKKLGRPPTRVEVHKEMHALKEGKTYSAAAKQIHDQMEDLQSEYPEIEVDHANTQEDIYGRVRGPEKSSRVRTFGLGVTPTMVFAKKSEGLSEVERREIESKHQLEFEKYNQEMDANYERKKVEMEAQMENKVSEKVAAMQVELERKMHAKLQEKIDAYLDSLRFSPESPQDVSSGTGQKENQDHISPVLAPKKHEPLEDDFSTVLAFEKA